MAKVIPPKAYRGLEIINMTTTHPTQTDRPLEIEAADDTECVHCGCGFNRHKGGVPGEPADQRRKCPRLFRGMWGVPDNYPWSTPEEDRTKDYTGYWQRVDAYWSATTVFSHEETGSEEQDFDDHNFGEAAW